MRQKAKAVQEVKTPQVQKLIDEMLATMKDINGVGVAAPQVYQSLRIYTVASSSNPRYPNAPKMRPLPMIIPLITFYSKATVKDWEGCLSIPGIRSVSGSQIKTYQSQFYHQRRENWSHAVIKILWRGLFSTKMTILTANYSWTDLTTTKTSFPKKNTSD